MHAQTPEELGAWIRWYHLPLFPALVAQVLFVHTYLESSTKWLMWTVIAMRAFILVANFALPIRVDEAIKNAVSLAESEARAQQVALILRVPTDLPPVSGDSIHLSQVLLNLLINGIQAVQSRPPGARRVVIEARANAAKGEVEIGVLDSGPGIPGAIVHRIFDPLFTTKPEGMGMGLALSHTIIEAHGGRLWVDKEAGQEGAVFRFTLRAA